MILHGDGHVFLRVSGPRVSVRKMIGRVRLEGHKTHFMPSTVFF